MSAGIKVGDCKTVNLLVLQSPLASQDLICKAQVSEGFTFSFIFFSKRRDLSRSHSVEREAKYKKGEKYWGLRTEIQASEV